VETPWEKKKKDEGDVEQSAAAAPPSSSSGSGVKSDGDDTKEEKGKGFILATRAKISQAAKNALNRKKNTEPSAEVKAAEDAEPKAATEAEAKALKEAEAKAAKEAETKATKKAATTSTEAMTLTEKQLAAYGQPAVRQFTDSEKVANIVTPKRVTKRSRVKRAAKRVLRFLRIIS